MKIYDSANKVPHGWFKLDSPSSPLSWCPPDALERGEAAEAGFRPSYRGTEFVPVKTSFSPGFRGVSSRVYVSIWSR